MGHSRYIAPSMSGRHCHLGSPFAVKLNKSRWDAVRGLRNSTSHPSGQVILDPGQGKGVLETAVELLNDLFS